MGLMMIMMMIVITGTACNPPIPHSSPLNFLEVLAGTWHPRPPPLLPGPVLTLDSAATLQRLAAAFYTKLPITIWMGFDLLSVDYGEKSSENLGLVAGLLGMLTD